MKIRWSVFLFLISLDSHASRDLHGERSWIWYAILWHGR